MDLGMGLAGQRRVNQAMRNQVDECAKETETSARNVAPSELLLQRAEALRREAHELENLGRELMDCPLSPRTADQMANLLARAIIRY